jgi:hypothetical protein
LIKHTDAHTPDIQVYKKNKRTQAYTQGRGLVNLVVENLATKAALPGHLAKLYYLFNNFLNNVVIHKLA